jgi:hypothetical protein
MELLDELRFSNLVGMSCFQLRNVRLLMFTGGGGRRYLLADPETALQLNRLHHAGTAGGVQHLFLDLAIGWAGIDEHCA